MESRTTMMIGMKFGLRSPFPSSEESSSKNGRDAGELSDAVDELRYVEETVVVVVVVVVVVEVVEVVVG